MNYLELEIQYTGMAQRNTHCEMCLCVPSDDKVNIKLITQSEVLSKIVEHCTVLSLSRAFLVYCQSRERAQLDSTKGAKMTEFSTIETFEGVWKMRLGAHGSHETQLGNVLQFSTVLNL